MTNKLPKDFIESDEYCVIEPGLTKFNKDQIISHADLLDYLKDDVATINDLSLLPHMSDKKIDLNKEYEKLDSRVKRLLSNTESEMNELIQRFNSKVETAVNDEDNQHVEDYSQ